MDEEKKSLKKRLQKTNLQQHSSRNRKKAQQTLAFKKGYIADTEKKNSTNNFMPTKLNIRDNRLIPRKI